MARALRRAGLSLPLPALVGASTLLHWLSARRLTGLWIMPDEAIYAERAIGFWRHLSLPVLHGQGAGYSVLYPIVAGIPLSFGSVARGYASLKLLQSLVVSLSAVPIFLYGRRWMPSSYALVAAALTVTSPLLLYAGLVMTEVLYYPLAALALVAIARAIETTRLRDQGIAFGIIVLCVLTRVQAIVLVAVFAAAILLDAALARHRRRLRAFWPVWALLAVAALVAAGKPGVFGAYAGTLSGNYPLGSAIKFVYYHLAYTILMVGIAPLAALALLGLDGVRGRIKEPGARALVAVSLAATLLVVLQVGFFSARYAPHLLGRDLAALPPILYLVFALWLSRGLPRPGIAASLAVLAVAAIVLAAPWKTLVTLPALPDTLGLASYLENSTHDPSTDIALTTVVTLLLVRFVPRRLALLLPALLVAALAVSSVDAANLLESKVRFDQAAMVGTPRDWIEHATNQPVAYVYNGDIASWNVVWQQRFWNPLIVEAVALKPFFVPGPLRERNIPAPADGKLGVPERYVVANNADSFIGTPVAHQDRGPDQFGLTLWHLTPPARISMITAGVNVNGDIEGPATVTVFDCRNGTLNLTLLPKSTSTVHILLGGKLVQSADIEGLPYWNGAVPVPASHTSDICRFTIVGQLLLGSTQISFSRLGD